MRKLSKAVKEGKKGLTFAYCCVCQETFIDDIPGYVKCPNGCPVQLQKNFILPHTMVLEEQACLWDSMPETHPGSGIKIGQLSCPCPKCSPVC